MKNLMFIFLIAILPIANSCDSTSSILKPTIDQQARIIGSVKVDWSQWITKGFSWRIHNIDGTEAIVTPYKFVGKTLPEEFIERSKSLKSTDLNGLVNLVSTYKNAVLISTEVLIDLPDKYKLKEIRKVSSSPGGKQAQVVCTDYYYQVCSSTGCSQPYYNYTTCETIEPDREVTNTPMPVVIGSGGDNDGLAYNNSSEGKHETNQIGFSGKIQCSSFGIRRIPNDQMPGNMRYEGAIKGLSFIFSDNRKVVLNDVYYSLSVIPNGLPYTPAQAKELLAKAADAAALGLLMSYDNPANTAALLKGTYMEYLRVYLNYFSGISSSGSNNPPDGAEVRNYSVTDRNRGVFLSSAFYVKPNIAYNPCRDTPE